MQQSQPQSTHLEKDALSSIEHGIADQLQKNDNNNLITNYRNIYHLDWKLHLYWILAIICFILARLWWLVPLPGADFLPAYRTYPANFFNTLFLGLGCAFATRSITVALVRTFRNGVHPHSVIAFGATGGFGAMISGIRYRSGLRYFLVAFLVTAATLLGDLLEGELQSSVMVYYKAGGTMDMNLAECRHTNVSDYEAASSAYQQGLVTHTLSDAQGLVNSTQHQGFFGVSVIQTTLTPVEDITLASASVGANNLRRRHWHRPTTTCDDYNQGGSGDSDSSSTSEIAVTTTITTAATGTVTATTPLSSSTVAVIPGTNGGNSIASIAPTISSGQQQQVQHQNNTNSVMILSLYGEKILINNTAITSAGGNNNNNSITSSSNLTVYKSVGADGKLKALPYQSQQSGNATVQLAAIRHTTSDGKEAVLIYPLTTADAGLASGILVSASATNYTCQPLTGCVATSSEPTTVNNKVIADALLAAIQSGTGLYGTSSADALTLAVVNHDPKVESKSPLVDALFANPNCPESALLPMQGHALLPYTAAHWTILGIIWIVLYGVLWAIGAYLIGLSEETWSQLARTGRMITLVVNNSSNLFVNGDPNAEPVEQMAFLNLADGKFGFVRVHDHNHGFTLSEVELPEQEGDQL